MPGSSTARVARGRRTRSSRRHASCPSSARRGSSSTTPRALSSRTGRRSSWGGSRRRAVFRWASTSRARRGSGAGPAPGRSPGRAAVASGADLVATAVYPLALTLHRVSGESVAESLHGLGHAPGLDIDKLWEAADVIDEWIGDEPVAHVAPRIAVRAAEYDLPAGLVAALEVHLR